MIIQNQVAQDSRSRTSFLWLFQKLVQSLRKELSKVQNDYIFTASSYFVLGRSTSDFKIEWLYDYFFQISLANPQALGYFHVSSSSIDEKILFVSLEQDLSQGSQDNLLQLVPMEGTGRSAKQFSTFHIQTLSVSSRKDLSLDHCYITLKFSGMLLSIKGTRVRSTNPVNRLTSCFIELLMIIIIQKFSSSETPFKMTSLLFLYILVLPNQNKNTHMWFYQLYLLFLPQKEVKSQF